MPTLSNESFFSKQKGTFIIAEVGKNFIQTEDSRPTEEYLQNAKDLVLKAKEAGADAVKFQTHNVEDEQLDIKVISPHFKGSDRYNWVKRNDLATPPEFWRELKNYCDEIGILFFSTPMSRGAAKKLAENGVYLWKVGSGDILDFVTLDFMAETNIPIIISTGMSTEEEIDKAIDFLKKRNADFAIMHCVSKYPCPPEDLKIKTMEYLRKRYEMPVGFSDHSTEITSAVVAVALGAKIIEKHFSLDRGLWGSDHKVSLTPDEFKIMCEKIRAVESDEAERLKIIKENPEFLSDAEEKNMQEGEAAFRPLFRKSLMAGADIKKGTVLTKELIYAMRPQAYAGGLPSEEYENVLGKTIDRDLKKYDPITDDVCH